MSLDAWQIHFEVQVYEAERWMIDYVTQHQDEALHVARELLRRPEVGGVRVVKEVHNAEQNVTSARTILEEIRNPGAAAAAPAPDSAPARRSAGAPPAPRGPDRRRLEHGPALRHRTGTTLGLAAIGSLAAAASGTAALIWFALLA